MIKQALLALGFGAIYLMFVSPPAEVLNYENYQPADDFSAYIKPNRFKDIKLIKSSELESPEDIDIDQETGDVYTGNSKGTIYKISSNDNIEKFAQGKGHILRVQLDKPNNQMFFIDTRQGICKVDLTTKQITVLVKFQKYGALNSFDISDDGIIYFTETSSKFSLQQAALAILSARPDGSIYRYDPKTNQTTLVLDKLYCPNGIEVSPDGQYLYISQMGKFRVIRFNLNNKSVQTVIENLEAGPDNLRFNDKGQLWIGLPVYRDTFQDFLIQSRWLRNTLSKLSPSLIMKFVKSSYVGAIKINIKGEVLDYIKENTDKYQYLSTAMQYKDHLYLASFKHSAIAKVPIQSSTATKSEQLQL